MRSRPVSLGGAGEWHATRCGGVGWGKSALTCDSFEVFIEWKLHCDVCDPEQAGQKPSEEGPPALGPINSQGSV